MASKFPQQCLLQDSLSLNVSIEIVVLTLAPLAAKGNAKGEESRMRRASLRANYFVRLPHLLPDLNRRTIHIEESHLLTTLPTEILDADSPQEACLPGPDQV